MSKAMQTPLVDLLRGTPKDGRVCHEESPTSHHFIPYGRLCHEAADTITELRERCAFYERTNAEQAAILNSVIAERDGLNATVATMNIVSSFAKMTREKFIRSAVDRFLCWKLPESFYPDAGVTFDRRNAYEGPHWPIGTNLLTAEQAYQMFEHCIQERSVIMPKVEEQLAALRLKCAKP